MALSLKLSQVRFKTDRKDSRSGKGSRRAKKLLFRLGLTIAAPPKVTGRNAGKPPLRGGEIVSPGEHGGKNAPFL